MTDLVERVRGLWAEVAGAELPADGVRVVCSPGSGIAPPGWLGSVSVAGALLVTAPTPELAAAVERGLATSTVDDVLAGLAGETLGPARLAYLTEAPEVGDVEWVDAGGLAELFAAAEPAEVAESALTGLGAAVVREGGRVVAAAGWHPWPAATAHLGVLTATAARGRGLATRVAAAASADALGAGRLPQWRARVPASIRVAARLGYQDLGRQFSVRPVSGAAGPA